MRPNDWTRLAASVAVALALAGCATGSAAPTATPTAAPSSAPTGPQGMFTGHDVCRDGDAEEPPDTGAVVCDRVVTDARLTGTLTSSARGGLGTDPDVYTEWRTFRMTNDGGTWTCQQLMMGVMEGAGWVDQVCTGEEGYAGLTAYVHSISGTAASDWGVLGWVEEWSEP